MKALFLGILFLITINVNAQENTLLIYVDASAHTNKTTLKNKLYTALQDSENKLILYISNGTNPLTTTNIYEAQKLIEQIDKISTSVPLLNFDLDSLNKMLNMDSLLSEIRKRARDVEESIDFYFFFDASKCRTERQDIGMAEAFLLSNRLVYKKGLLRGINARLFIQNIHSPDDSSYFKGIANTLMFEIVGY